MKEEEAKRVVREGYAKIARRGKCCCSSTSDVSKEISRRIGYSEEGMSTTMTIVRMNHLLRQNRLIAG
jgi:hypothetical protein